MFAARDKFLKNYETSENRFIESRKLVINII